MSTPSNEASAEALPPTSSAPASASFDPTLPLYVSPPKSEWVVTVAGVLGVLVTLATIVVAIAVATPKFKADYSQAVVLSLAAAWAIGAPMWFFAEYFFMYRNAGAPDTWDQFKHGQQVSAAVWAGLTAALTVFGTSDYVKVSPKSWSCELQTPTSPASAVGVSQPVLANCKEKKE